MATATRARRPAARRRSPARRSSGWATTWRALRAMWVVGSWVGRWTGRTIGWAAPRVARGATTYGRALAGPYAERVRLYAEHGRVPLVRDLFSGEVVGARDVVLEAPGGGDPEVREQQAAALARQRYRDDYAHAQRGGGLQPPRLSWRERIGMRSRGEDPDEAADIMRRARMAVAARRAERLARAADKHWPEPAQDVRPARPGDPEPIDLDDPPGSPSRPTRPTGKEPVMANDVRNFNDLLDPGVDPFEYPEQLPDHYGQVEKLIGDDAAEIESHADAMKGKAQALRAYVEYMETAEVDGDAMAGLEESAAAYELAEQQLRAQAEQVRASADLMGAAKRAADAEYGDQKVLRFDKAG